MLSGLAGGALSLGPAPRVVKQKRCSAGRRPRICKGDCDEMEGNDFDSPTSFAPPQVGNPVMFYTGRGGGFDPSDLRDGAAGSLAR